MESPRLVVARVPGATAAGQLIQLRMQSLPPCIDAREHVIDAASSVSRIAADDSGERIKVVAGEGAKGVPVSGPDTLRTHRGENLFRSGGDPVPEFHEAPVEVAIARNAEGFDGAFDLFARTVYERYSRLDRVGGIGADAVMIQAEADGVFGVELEVAAFASGGWRFQNPPGLDIDPAEEELEWDVAADAIKNGNQLAGVADCALGRRNGWRLRCASCKQSIFDRGTDVIGLGHPELLRQTETVDGGHSRVVESSSDGKTLSEDLIQ